MNTGRAVAYATKGLAAACLAASWQVPAWAAEGPGLLGQVDLRGPINMPPLSTPLQLMLLMAFLTLLPFFFIMTTSFMRTVIVLSFLRTAIGTQQEPPNQVIVGIAIFLSIYVMTPVWTDMNVNALQPYLNRQISQPEAFNRALKPLRKFMFAQTRQDELAFFLRLARQPYPKTPDDVGTHILIPAFMVSELTTGFKIGFVIFLPFLIIDLVVANTLLALGMMMLSPVTISMPFKLLIFTLANGWHLIIQAIVQSFKM